MLEKCVAIARRIADIGGPSQYIEELGYIHWRKMSVGFPKLKDASDSTQNSSPNGRRAGQCHLKKQ